MRVNLSPNAARRAILSSAVLMAVLSVADSASAGTPAESNLRPHPGLPPLPYQKSPDAIPNYIAGEKWGTQGEVRSEMQLPISPAESHRHIVTIPGFRTELWASEPEILKPICMAWDERGRLWIAETIDYPNELQPAGQGRDRIKICEDTDADGKADKFTVFAEGLSIPTGMVFARGGLIVVESGHTLFLKDTNGDDKADERRVLFEGWGMGDTHATASNLRYGPDNWIWGVVGYSGFDGDVGGKRVRFSMGVYRFKSDGSQLEFVRSSNNNTWGLGFSEDGTVFGSTANNNASWYMAVANRYYESVNGWTASRMETIADRQDFYPVTSQVRQVDAHGRYTAGAGHALYTARNYPQDFWNRVSFVTEPTGHLIGMFRLEGKGADYVARNDKSFLASSDEWCAPIMAEVGPDGAVWVLDWYNYIIQHNPTPHGFKNGKGNAYETPLRDKRHGRIYRVAWEQARKVAPINLTGATTAKLVETLRNDNQLWRLHAQRLLVEKGGTEAVPALLRLAQERSVDPVGLNVGAQHALWTLSGLGVGDASNVRRAANTSLRHRSAAVRRAGLGVLPRDAAGAKSLLDARLLEDPDAQVRLAAFLAVADMPEQDALGAATFAALRQEPNAGDRWIPHAATSAGAKHHRGFLKAATSPAVRGMAQAFPDSVLEAVRVVSAHHATVDSASGLATALALKTAPAVVAAPILDGLTAGWPAGKTPTISADDEKRLQALALGLSDSARGSLIALADRWGRREIFASVIDSTAAALRGRLGEAGMKDDERIALARRLVTLDDRAESVRAVLALITPQTAPSLTTGLLQAVGVSRQSATAGELLGAWSRLTPAARRATISTLLRRTEWAQGLLAAVESGRLDRTDIANDQWGQLRNNPDRQIAEKARDLSGKKAIKGTAEMEAMIQKLLPVANRTGDAARGRQVFETSCQICHALNGKGQRIGPDLTGIGVRPKSELLVEILDPNRSVEANYRLWTVVTRDGETVAGRLDTETATSIEILDTAGQKHAIQRKDIQSIEPSNQSIMPGGFEQLPADDLAGLLEYLATSAQHK
jgi:putative membrane-bound dehydrogenase-like protein